MDELIKKVAEAFRDYVLKSPELQEMVEKIAEQKAGDISEYRIKELVNSALNDINWKSRITDNLNTNNNVFKSNVKDIVRNMRFRVEVD
jgi:hypothetical protein